VQPAPGDLSGEAGRSGPLADLLYRETVAALHTELEARAADAARSRAELAQTRSELERRAGAQVRLQEAHVELREELAQLMSAVAGQRGEFDRGLAAVEAERDGAREQLEVARAELEVARAELESARAEAQAARSQAESELSASRAESEAMLSAARAESEAMVSAARADFDLQVQDAERRSGQLAERLQALTAADRRHADESSVRREQLAAAHVSRDAALGEAAGLRTELERLGSELAVVREQGTAPSGDLDEARQLLADARALTKRLSARSAD
jgi:chromosome segregation ATPase